MTNPCYKCEERCMGCHSYCEKYSAFKEEFDSKKKSFEENYSVDKYMISRKFDEKCKKAKMKKKKSRAFWR